MDSLPRRRSLPDALESRACSSRAHTSTKSCRRNHETAARVSAVSWAQSCLGDPAALRSRPPRNLPAPFSGSCHCGCCRCPSPRCHAFRSPDGCSVLLPSLAPAAPWSAASASRPAPRSLRSTSPPAAHPTLHPICSSLPFRSPYLYGKRHLHKMFYTLLFAGRNRIVLVTQTDIQRQIRTNLPLIIGVPAPE